MLDSRIGMPILSFLIMFKDDILFDTTIRQEAFEMCRTAEKLKSDQNNNHELILFFKSLHLLILPENFQNTTRMVPRAK